MAQAVVVKGGMVMWMVVVGASSYGNVIQVPVPYCCRFQD
jgi:hypothetical protein